MFGIKLCQYTCNNIWPLVHDIIHDNIISSAKKFQPLRR